MRALVRWPGAPRTGDTCVCAPPSRARVILATRVGADDPPVMAHALVAANITAAAVARLDVIPADP